jgi:hypothetical protein
MVLMIDAYVEGRPIPRSSSALTSDGSVNRGGGLVVWPSGRSSVAVTACSRTSWGSLDSASSASPPDSSSTVST